MIYQLSIVKDDRVLVTIGPSDAISRVWVGRRRAGDVSGEAGEQQK
jgi:hypothetical protein